MIAFSSLLMKTIKFFKFMTARINDLSLAGWPENLVKNAYFTNFFDYVVTMTKWLGSFAIV